MKNKISIGISRLFSIRDSNELNDNQESYWFQYFVGFMASLAMLNCGVQLTWFGPAVIILQNEELSPIDVVTNTEASWIFSFLQVGALPGSLFGSYLANKFGRKNTLIFTIIPTGLSHFLIIFVKNVYMLYVARIFAGLSVGITMVALPTYLTEVSSPRIRGILGTFTLIGSASSWILQFIIQPIMTLQLNSIIIFSISFVQYCVALYFLPETPHYYIMKGKEELAKKSLQKLRQRVNVENELFQIKECGALEEQNKIPFFEYLLIKSIRKRILILLPTVLGQQFSGALIVKGYIPAILNESIPIVSTYYGSLVLVVSFILGTTLSTLFVDKFGRRFLFITSGIVMAIFTALIGVYYVFESIHGIETVSKYSITLFVLLFCYFITFAFGQLSMVNIYVGELFETHFRATAGLIASASNGLCGFFAIQAYGIIYRNFGLQYIFLFFTVCCILFTIFGYYLLPETKGKSLQEIQKDLL